MSVDAVFNINTVQQHVCVRWWSAVIVVSSPPAVKPLPGCHIQAPTSIINNIMSSPLKKLCSSAAQQQQQQQQ